MRQSRVRGFDGVLEPARQEDRERRSFAHRALDGDGAPSLPHDAFDGCEAEPGASAWRLGREERLEDAPNYPLGDARSRVAHEERNVFAGRESLTVPAAEDDVLRFEQEAPAVRHRIPRVEREVDDDLLDVPAIGANRV